jgi:hypothetical protein
MSPEVPPIKVCDPNILLNLDTKICVNKPIPYRFNEKAEYIIESRVSYNGHQVQIKKVIKSNPFGQGIQCATNKPYSLLTRCITCEGSSLILVSQLCGSCLKGSKYDTWIKNLQNDRLPF